MSVDVNTAKPHRHKLQFTQKGLDILYRKEDCLINILPKKSKKILKIKLIKLSKKGKQVQNLINNLQTTFQK